MHSVQNLIISVTIITVIIISITCIDILMPDGSRHIPCKLGGTADEIIRIYRRNYVYPVKSAGIGFPMKWTYEITTESTSRNQIEGDRKRVPETMSSLQSVGENSNVEHAGA